MPADLATPALRPQGPADGPFLLQLYASTRQEELEALGWPAAAREAFLTMQFKAWQQGYRAAFPRAQFAIILSGHQPIGHLVINRAQEEFRLVDIALLPPHRGRGIGTALVLNLLREAAAAQKPVRLSVLRRQRACRLYQRLGFAITGQDGPRDQMEWRGNPLPQNDPSPCAPA